MSNRKRAQSKTHARQTNNNIMNSAMFLASLLNIGGLATFMLVSELGLSVASLPSIATSRA